MFLIPSTDRGWALPIFLVLVLWTHEFIPHLTVCSTLGAKASPPRQQGLFFLHTKGGRRHKQRAEKGKRNQIKSQRIARAATHEVPSMRSSLICGRMIHGLFGWKRIDGEACEAPRPCGRIRCRGLLPRGPRASGSYRQFRHGVLNAREWAGARVPYRWGYPPGTPDTGGPRASQGRNSTAWGGSWRPLLAGGTRYRKCPAQALITLTSSITSSK